MTSQVWHDAWAAALDDLEVTLEAAERLLRGEEPGQDETPAWHPPDMKGPMPAEHVARAQALLGRQRLLISQVASARVGVRQKLELLAKLTGSNGSQRSSTPVYVDLTA